jgi:hypothetical protein
MHRTKKTKENSIERYIYNCTYMTLRREYLMNEVKVKVVSKEFNTIGPTVTYVHPKQMYKVVTVCTVVLTDGLDAPPTMEKITGESERHLVVGTHVETNENAYDQEHSENLAFQDALNKLAQHGLLLVD